MNETAVPAVSGSARQVLLKGSRSEAHSESQGMLLFRRSLCQCWQGLVGPLLRPLVKLFVVRLQQVCSFEPTKMKINLKKSLIHITSIVP